MDLDLKQPSIHGITKGPKDLIAEPSAAAILEVLQKILSSAAFRNVENLREFLRYVVEQSLQGHEDRIKEYTIGLEVFHRTESFDPRRDNIVRVRARRLRWALLSYYQEEGANDLVRIDLPNGAYKPVFRLLSVPHRGEPPEIAEPIEDPEWKAPWKQRRWIVATLAALFLIAGAAWFLKSRFDRAGDSANSSSIAVLPFRTLGNKSTEEFLSDGLTEDLTNSLAQIPRLRVVAPTSAFVYKGKAVDIRKVGKDLSVRAVLEGSVQRVDDRVRVTAQLSDTTTGLHIWSSSYDREMKDALAIQREISNSIAQTLGVTLAGAKPHNSDNGVQLPSEEAYENYLKGLYFLDRPTLRNLETATSYFQRAIDRDPPYAPAYAALADAYAVIPTWKTPAENTSLKVRETALKALSLDHNLGEAHVDLAEAYVMEYQWPKAEEELKKALELSPGVAVVHMRYGSFLMKVGRLPESLVELYKALNLDPASSNATRLVARPLYFMHHFDDGIAQNKQAMELDPNSARNHDELGSMYIMKGMYADGIAQLEVGHNIAPDMPWYSGNLAWANAIAGKKDVAQKILDDLLKRAAQDSAPSLAIARAYIGLGDKDHAFEWLEKAFASRNPSMPYLKVDPLYDPLRSDKRFSDLLKRMNL